MKPRTALISGIDVGGSTFAWWLSHYGFEPALVERAIVPRAGGCMIDFWRIGYEVVEKMAAISELRALGYVIDEVRLVDRDAAA
ncbi:MAG TPA: hypothetical protein VGN07_09885 [Steroidobacteraceae bacterium]|jgi:2-polyprenyl-6-methoxyphenol hydroxylase-like FAD-dependent oxidoreductase